MTQTTDSRQLRLLFNGILSAHGIDNLELEIRLVDAVRKMLGSATPARTREEIVASLQKSMTSGAARHEKLQAIEGEIRTRIHINPVTRDWQDFCEWALKQEEKGETIVAFLDWWLSDEWQKTHPPTKPESWYVKWSLAFANKSEPAVTGGVFYG